MTKLQCLAVEPIGFELGGDGLVIDKRGTCNGDGMKAGPGSCLCQPGHIASPAPSWNSATKEWEGACLRCASSAACPDGTSCGEFVEGFDPELEALQPCGRCESGVLVVLVRPLVIVGMPVSVPAELRMCYMYCIILFFLLIHKVPHMRLPRLLPRSSG